LLDGQYSNPVRVISFNTAERWSRDASDEIADALRRGVTCASNNAKRWLDLAAPRERSTPNSIGSSRKADAHCP
jgi:hypothetical protein